jgi:hypothetical protein
MTHKFPRFSTDAQDLQKMEEPTPRTLRPCYEYNRSRHGMEEPTTIHSKNGRTHHGSEEPNRTTEDPTMEWKNPLRLLKVPPWN